MLLTHIVKLKCETINFECITDFDGAFTIYFNFACSVQYATSVFTMSVFNINSHEYIDISSGVKQLHSSTEWIEYTKDITYIKEISSNF